MFQFLLFLFGVFLYSFLEYGVHRWLFHGPLMKYHKHHHRSPQVPRPIPLWALALPMLGLFWLNVWMELGVLTGLAAYETIHQQLHHGALKHSRMLRLGARHLLHHTHPNTNYGVLFKFWDRIFNTL